MLNFKNISLRRGIKVLFTQTSFTLHKGQKAGITGANGVGKSSFFSLIQGILHADEGEFSMPPGLRIAHVAQETPALETTALDFVIDGDRDLRKLQQQAQVAEQQNDGMQLAELHAALEAIDAYRIPAKAARLLSGLGFEVNQHQQAVQEFSGGWRMRLNLAQALMCRSDVLLLDEPTNHLDLDAVIWLQEWLVSYAGTLLLISHDRDFLDTITSHIVHIEKQQAQIYTGNYSAFETMRAEKLAQQQTSYEKQQREITHIQSFITRFKAQATKAKQAQSRVKSLERMVLITQAHIDSPFNFSFPAPEKMPNPLLQLEDAQIGYPTKIILDNVTMSVAPGDRIGLLGANGAGKSSLIKVLAADMQALSGIFLQADALRLGYFAQHQLEQLHLDATPLWHLQRIDPKATEKELRNFLGGFDFKGDQVLELVAPFSGGEKARLVLALIVYQNPNLLLLDEPTNHLDIEMRHALSVALQNYQGAMIVVSHDRHLLRSVTDKFLLVADGKVMPFDGDLDDYRLWLAAQKKQLKNLDAVTEVAETTRSRKALRQQEAQRRQRLKPLTDALKQAETQLEFHHEQQQELEQQLSNSALYQASEKERLKALLAQKAEIDKAVDSTEEAWMLASEQLEQAEI